MFKRPWKQYLGNIKEQLNGYSGIAGLGGAVGTVVSPTLFPTMTVMAASVSGVVTVLAIGTALYRAVPSKYLDAKDLIGTTITLQDLKSIYPPITTVGILGISQVGKTSLRFALLQRIDQITRTQHEGAHIMSLQSNPQKYLALLDGAGEQYSQQFEIAELADLLIVVIDHNESASDPKPKQNRMRAHEDFLRQLKHHLTRRHASPKKAVLFLRNKSDLWYRAPAADRQSFQIFCQTESAKWHGNLASNVASSDHSNTATNAVSSVASQLRPYC